MRLSECPPLHRELREDREEDRGRLTVWLPAHHHQHPEPQLRKKTALTSDSGPQASSTIPPPIPTASVACLPGCLAFTSSRSFHIALRSDALTRGTGFPGVNP